MSTLEFELLMEVVRCTALVLVVAFCLHKRG